MKWRYTICVFGAIAYVIVLIFVTGCKSTPTLQATASEKVIFKQYDERMIKLVQDRWLNLVDAISKEQLHRGKVVLQFNLQSDGRITDIMVIKNTTSSSLESICEKAMLDSSPYGNWPPEMLKVQGKPFRTITFSFYYQ